MAVRQISGGAGLMFKGSGFYITDYGKDGKGPRKAESVAEGGDSKPADKRKGGEVGEVGEDGEAETSPSPAKAEKPASETASKSARKKGRK